MSEETTNYGIPNTTLDTEPFPPQTGDLLGAYLARVSRRVRTLEAASAEQSAYQRSLEDRIERLEALISQPESGSWRNTGSSATFTNVKPVPTGDTVCATCGHDEADHLITEGDKAQFLLCDGGTLGKPCRCTGYRP